MNAGMKACELCGDQQDLVLSSRCHFTAPLKAVKTKEEVILSCYLPDCGKEVVRLPLADTNALRTATRLLNGCLLDRNMPMAQRDEIVLWLKKNGVPQ